MGQVLLMLQNPCLKLLVQPWNLDFHDQESTMTCEELMSFISLMDYSVSQTNPYAEDSSCNTTEGCQLANIDGFGNYNIKIYGAPNSEFANSSVLNLFFLDSGDRGYC